MLEVAVSRLSGLRPEILGTVVRVSNRVNDQECEPMSHALNSKLWFQVNSSGLTVLQMLWTSAYGYLIRV